MDESAAEGRRVGKSATRRELGQQGASFLRAADPSQDAAEVGDDLGHVRRDGTRRGEPFAGVPRCAAQRMTIGRAAVLSQRHMARPGERRRPAVGLHRRREQIGERPILTPLLDLVRAAALDAPLGWGVVSGIRP